MIFIRAPPLCGGRPIVITLSIRASVRASGPNCVRPRDFLFFHIPVGLWYLACRCITMRWCVAYQYCLCMTLTLTSGSIIYYGGVYSCLPQKFFIFSHRFMTFGMYVHFKETMCCIPILKIVHNYHTSIFPVLQVHKFHLHRTHWWGPHEMAPISMVSSYTSSHDQNFDFNWQHLVFRSMWLFLCCAILWPSRYQCCVSNITVFKWLF